MNGVDPTLETWNIGTQIRIENVSALGGFMQVEVRPAKQANRSKPA